MSGTNGNRWYDEYEEAQWALVWLAMDGYSAEQVEAAERHLLPVERDGERLLARPTLRRPLDPSALVRQTEREIREDRHPRPGQGSSLLTVVKQIFDGVLLRAYLDALPEPDFTRMYKNLIVRAAHELKSSRWGRLDGAELREQAKDLLQTVLLRACQGRRRWPRVGDDLLPLITFLDGAMKSVASHRRARPGLREIRYDDGEELERIIASSAGYRAALPQNAGEATLLADLAEHLLGNLSGSRRELLVLLLQGDTPREIHEKLGVPLSTIYRWSRAVRHRLEAAISEPSHVEIKER